jgi:hypothetical protein
VSRRPSTPTSPPTSTSSTSAPTGIKILAALNVIGALLALGIIGRVLSIDHPLAGVLGLGLLLFIAAGLVFTYGLVTMQYWGWAGTLAFNGLGALLELVSADIIGLIVSGIIIFYLLSVADEYEK